MSGLLTLLAIVAAGYTLLVGYFYLRQESLLFLPNLPTRSHWATPEAAGLEYESVSVATADGETLDGWFVPGRPDGMAMLFFHGNAGNISHRLDSLRMFHQLGLSVLIVDYRGYGRSTGRPSEEGTYQDALAAWHWLTEDRGMDPRRVVLFGRSLGGAVAAWLATRVQPAGLVVEGTFRSVPALGADLYPWLPVRSLSRLDYDTEAYLRDARCPVLVIHGAGDEIVPLSHARALRAAAPGDTELLELEGGHNDAFLADRERYLDGLSDFLEGLAR
ncbi:MAG: alpha/beta hydrolase [Gammaproteobacteria bacterium]